VAVLAVQQIRRMRGGAQGQLMLCSDGHIYVVKFQNNPQHMRVLANEFLASRLAAAAGLSVPQVELVEVSSWLIENTPGLEMELGHGRVRCQPGLQFGSRYAGGLMPGQVVDYLPEEQLAEVRNLGEFAGILALDKWTGNANGRQAVFVRKGRERRYRAVFIDFGYCFHAGDWRFEDAPLRGVYPRNSVYHGGDLGEMEALVEKLLARRGRIREWIEGFANTERRPFPEWGKIGEERVEEVWNQGWDGATMGGRPN
jgi:hypothetical protein